MHADANQVAASRGLRTWAGLAHTPERAPTRLDATAAMLGIGRSATFPLPEWRAADPYHTVYFDEGHGRTLVFVHGLGGNATHFEPTIRALKGSYRLVGLDLVGCGWTDKPHRDYSIAALADHLEAFLDARGIRRATLIGHSLGGAVCLATALRRPGQVEALVLLCAAGVAPVPAWMRSLAPLFLRRSVLFPTLLAGHDFILKHVFVDSPDRNPHVAWFRQAALEDAPGYPHLRDFARVCETLCRDVLRGDFSDRFAHVHAPVLALWGDHDPLIALSSALGRLDGLRRLLTVVLPRTGHMPMVERPRETAELIERFLAAPP